jgi:hypothetical protein
MIEDYGTEPWPGHGHQIESIAEAAAIWPQLAPTQDALAREGLVFLRQTIV